MKFIIMLLFALPTYSQELPQIIIDKAMQSHNRHDVEVNDEFKIQRQTIFSHGPILSSEAFKYGIEYSLTVYSRVDQKNQQVTYQRSTVSVMELNYCDFVYADEFFRFRRHTFHFDKNRKLKRTDEYTATPDLRNNDGYCRSEVGTTQRVTKAVTASPLLLERVATAIQKLNRDN